MIIEIVRFLLAIIYDLVFVVVIIAAGVHHAKKDEPENTTKSFKYVDEQQNDEGGDFLL